LFLTTQILFLGKSAKISHIKELKHLSQIFDLFRLFVWSIRVFIHFVFKNYLLFANGQKLYGARRVKKGTDERGEVIAEVIRNVKHFYRHM